MFKYRNKPAAFFLILLIISLTGCQPKDISNQEVESSSNEISVLLDSIHNRILYYYGENPDSAELLLGKTIDITDSLKLEKRQFYAFMNMVELYQYIKPDYIKAAENLRKAIKLFIQNPSLYVDNPYVFIDIGNVYLYFDMTPQAIPSYRIAASISKSFSNHHPAALAFQNISIAYETLNELDSSLYYITIAGELISQEDKLTLARNYLTKAGIFESIPQPDSIIANAWKSLSASITCNDSANRSSTGDNKDLIRALNRIEMIANRMLAYAFRIKAIPDSSLIHYERARQLAKLIGTNTDLAALYTERILLESMITSPAKSLVYADSLFSLIPLTDDKITLKLYSDSLSAFFNRIEFKKTGDRFKRISSELTDSIEQGKGRVKLPDNDLILASVATEQAYSSLRTSELKGRKTIKFQKITIIILFLLVAAIMSTLAFLVSLKRKTEAAYLELAEKVSRNIALEDEKRISKNKPERTGRSRDLAGKLEECINFGKPYINPDFGISDLAALLGTNTTYVSTLLNHEFGLNFNEYINQQRVKEFCRMVDDEDNKGYSIDQLSEKVGFRTRSTFYLAFRKFTGMTPAAYQKARRLRS